MLVVGLTGGLGSGKTTVAKLFEALGVPIIDADVSAKKLTARGQPALTHIIKHFGQHLLKTDGSLDRGKLRHLVFADSDHRLWLEKLLHPLILKDMHQQMASLHAPYCIAVIPLLLEVEFYSFIDRILVVDAPESEQIRRVKLRDKIRREEIEAILKTQTSREERCAKAHDVIVNIGKMAHLEPQVKILHEKYIRLSQDFR